MNEWIIFLLIKKEILLKPIRSAQSNDTFLKMDYAKFFVTREDIRIVNSFFTTPSIHLFALSMNKSIDAMILKLCSYG